MKDFIQMDEFSEMLPLELIKDLIQEVYKSYELIGDIDLAIEDGIQDSMLLEETREFLLKNKKEIESGVKFTW